MVDLVDRVNAIAERAIARKAVQTDEVEAKRAVLREQMPEVAALVDQLRAVGFEPVVLAASEAGRTVVNRAACAKFCVDMSEYV